MWNGARRRYIPDFLIRLANGKTLVLEIKGEDTEQNRAKLAAMRAWVEGVNAKGGFGRWCCDVAYEMAKIQDILAAHGQPSAVAVQGGGRQLRWVKEIRRVACHRDEIAGAE